MKRLLGIMLLISFFSLPSLLFATEPIIRTWKLNVSKSKYPPDRKPPKEQTETYRELADGQMELTYQKIEKNGSSILEVLVYPFQGGMVKILKGDSPFTFI